MGEPAKSAPLGPGVDGCDVFSLSRSAREESAFLAALRERQPRAVTVMFDRHHRRVARTIVALLGPDTETPDLVQEVFINALQSLPQFHGDASQLASWIRTITVFTVRGHIRRRSGWRRRFRLGMPSESAALEDGSASAEVMDALRRVYDLVDGFPDKERIPFLLRHVEQLNLEELADACGVSLATAKRRLRDARARMDKLARRDPVLIDWLGRTNG